MLAPNQEWRSQLLYLRVKMDSGILDTDAREGENSSGEVSKSLTTRFTNLNPMRRRIIMELIDRGDLIGEWDITAQDFGLAWDPEGLLQAKEGLSRVHSILGALAARGALAVNSWLPRVIGQITADNLRRDYTPQMVLPLSVAEGLSSVLLSRVPKREIIWLSIEEPAGYTPYLNWERLLRPHVGVPIVRLPGRPVNPVSPRNTLDVLMTCSTASTRLIASPAKITRLIRGILSTLPAPHRCIVHLFADETYRPALLAALIKAKISVVEEGEPTKQRGVIVYKQFGLPPGGGDSLDESDPADHPWAAWIASSLGAKAVDVVHVIADGHLSAAIAALKVSAMPWRRSRDPKQASSSGEGAIGAQKTPGSRRPATAEGIRVRYVDALQMRDFTRRIGAWATILSSSQESARGAHRVLAHRLTQAATGVYAVHEFDGDAAGKSAIALYRMLVADHVTTAKGGSDGVPVPDTPQLSLYCHPDRILRTARDAQQSITDVLPVVGDAVQKIREAMEVPQATPAWLAVSQRYLEDVSSECLDAQPLSERASAARDGVGEAVEFALRAIAESSGSISQQFKTGAASGTDK